MIKIPMQCLTTISSQNLASTYCYQNLILQWLWKKVIHAINNCYTAKKITNIMYLYMHINLMYYNNIIYI